MAGLKKVLGAGLDGALKAAEASELEARKQDEAAAAAMQAEGGMVEGGGEDGVVAGAKVGKMIRIGAEEIHSVKERYEAKRAKILDQL